MNSGFGEVLKLAAKPKVELPAQAPDRVRSGGMTGSVNMNTSVRDRQRLADVKNAPAITQPMSETEKLMRVYARANARAESEEKARQEIWAQRAAAQDRANQIELTKAKQQLFRSMDAYDIIEPVMALVHSWKRETSIDAYRVAIEQVRRKNA
jgi:hypothetical protein